MAYNQGVAQPFQLAAQNKQVYIGSAFFLDRLMIWSGFGGCGLVPPSGTNGVYTSIYYPAPGYSLYNAFLTRFTYVDPEEYVGGDLLAVVYFDGAVYVDAIDSTVPPPPPIIHDATIFANAIADTVNSLIAMIARFKRIKIKVYMVSGAGTGPDKIDEATAAAETAFRTGVAGVPEIEIVDGILSRDGSDATLASNQHLFGVQITSDFNDFFGT